MLRRLHVLLLSGDQNPVAKERSASKTEAPPVSNDVSAAAAEGKLQLETTLAEGGGNDLRGRVFSGG